jgi:hypothetical protein
MLYPAELRGRRPNLLVSIPLSTRLFPATRGFWTPKSDLERALIFAKIPNGMYLI